MGTAGSEVAFSDTDGFLLTMTLNKVKKKKDKFTADCEKVKNILTLDEWCCPLLLSMVFSASLALSLLSLSLVY